MGLFRDSLDYLGNSFRQEVIGTGRQGARATWSSLPTFLNQTADFFLPGNLFNPVTNTWEGPRLPTFNMFGRSPEPRSDSIFSSGMETFDPTRFWEQSGENFEESIGQRGIWNPRSGPTLPGGAAITNVNEDGTYNQGVGVGGRRSHMALGQAGWNAMQEMIRAQWDRNNRVQEK